MDLTSDAINSIPAPAKAPTVLATGRTPFERRRVLSAAVDLASPREIVSHLVECANNRCGCSVVGISAPYATAMADDAALRSAFLSADLLIPDGKGFTWGARMLGVPCPERLAIPDLCEILLREGDERGWKVFIYGATEEVNAAACANVRARFPRLKEVAGQHGYNQTPELEDTLIERLGRERFNLLIVARPSPDKELFLAKCCRAAGVVGLAAGGYADILAGKTARAPKLVQALGMEWFYRIIQEPRRLWKRVGVANLRFAASVLWRQAVVPSRPFWGSRTVHVALVVLAIVAAYTTSLNAPYHFDDPEYIERNPTIRWAEGESFGDLSRRLSQITVLAHRKVWWLSNAICFKLSDLYGNHTIIESTLTYKPDVRIFRAWNIACHLIAALALMGLLRRCLRATGKLATGPESQGTPWDLMPFAAAAIFAAHPLCTESVTYICGRDNGQGGMFYLLGLWAAAVAFERMGLGAAVPPPFVQGGTEGGQSEVRPLRWPGWFWPLAASMAFGGLAVLTKESHLTFVAAVGLVYLCFYRGAFKQTVSVGLLLGLGLSMLAICWGASDRREGYLSVAAHLSLVLIIAGGFLGSSSADGSSPTGLRRTLALRVKSGWAFLVLIAGFGTASVIAFPYAYQRVLSALTGFQNSSYIRSLCSQAYAVPWMLLRGIAPYGLNIDHDFPSISDPSDPRALTGGAIIAALVIAGLFLGWRKSAAGFAILLALLYIAPSNSIIERGDIVSERNFYLVAACGACLLAWLAASVTEWIAARSIASTKADAKKALPILREAGLWTGVFSVCVGGPFSALTILRNDDWADPYRLWQAARERSPNKMRVQFNFGIAAQARKRWDEAEAAFSAAITTGEQKAERGMFRPDEAVEVKCFHLAYASLAQMHQLRFNKDPDKTKTTEVFNRIDKIFRNGLERTAYDPDLAYAYGGFLLQVGRSHDAAPILQRAFDLHSWADHLCWPLGQAYLDLGDVSRAEYFFTRASQMKELNAVGVMWEMPPERLSEVHAYIGLSRLLNQNPAGAMESFRTSMTYDPQGTMILLTTTLKTRNTKLKRPRIDTNDLLLIALTETRRDVLRTLGESATALLSARPDLNRGSLPMLRDSINAELARRVESQKERAKFGFTDDPDEGQNY